MYFPKDCIESERKTLEIKAYSRGDYHSLEKTLGRFLECIAYNIDSAR